jgi:hypothetical protein
MTQSPAQTANKSSIHLPGTPMQQTNKVKELGRPVDVPPEEIQKGERLFLILEGPYSLDATKEGHRQKVNKYLTDNPQEQSTSQWRLIPKKQLPKN